MNSRERVLRAFKRLPGLPDRVPVQFDLCRPLADHFGGKLGIPVHYTENLYEDVTYRISANELRVAMGSDVVVTGASVSDNYRVVKEADGTWLNEYRMRMRQGAIYVEVVDYPLARAETKGDIEAFDFPDPDAPGRFRDAEALVKKFKNDYLVIGDIEVTVFSLAHQLVGLEKLLVDMMMQTEYVVPLFEACAEFQTRMGLKLIEKGVDAIWFGDDFGTQTSLIIPQDVFREQLKPFYTRMIDRFRKANPDIIPILHCDGAVADLLDDIREIGFRGLQSGATGGPWTSSPGHEGAFRGQIRLLGCDRPARSPAQRDGRRARKGHYREDLHIGERGGLHDRAGTYPAARRLARPGSEVHRALQETWELSLNLRNA